MKKQNKFFRLYAHNIPVPGKERSAIYDLQRQEIVLIPNILQSILEALDRSTIDEVIAKYAPKRPDLIEKYLLFLHGKDLGFYTNSPERYPLLDLNWSSPYIIQSAVVAFEFSSYSIFQIADQLDKLHCQHVELRLNTVNSDPSDLFEVLEGLSKKTFRTITLLLNYSPYLLEENFTDKLFEAFKKINFIFVFNSPVQKNSHQNPKNISFLKKGVPKGRSGVRHIVNLDYFMEAQKHNPYYNKKVCIDEKGRIKNCLLHQNYFGNVIKDSIKNIISRNDFQKLWFASPDKIEDIRDSELRFSIFLTDELETSENPGLYRIKKAPEQQTFIRKPEYAIQ